MKCLTPRGLSAFHAGVMDPEAAKLAIRRVQLEEWRKARRAIAYVSKAARQAQPLCRPAKFSLLRDVYGPRRVNT